jgi:hypothetical protein
MIILQTVGLLGRGISSSQGLYLNTGQHKHRINTHTKHPCLMWDSDPRSGLPRCDRQILNIFKNINNKTYMKVVDLKKYNHVSRQGLLLSYIMWAAQSDRKSPAFRKNLELPPSSMLKKKEDGYSGTLHLLTSFTHSLTHSWSWALLEKRSIVQLLKNFPAFYGTWRFITVFIRALHW